MMVFASRIDARLYDLLFALVMLAIALLLAGGLLVLGQPLLAGVVLGAALLFAGEAVELCLTNYRRSRQRSTARRPLPVETVSFGDLLEVRVAEERRPLLGTAERYAELRALPSSQSGRHSAKRLRAS